MLSRDPHFTERAEDPTRGRDLAIAVVIGGIAAAVADYGPWEIIAGQTGLLLLDYLGCKAIDWYVARSERKNAS